MSDSASLQELLQPKKSKMTRIPFALQSAELDSASETSERLVNVYAEEAPPQARSKAFLKSIGGLEVQRTLGPGPVHAMNGDLPGRVYLVSGSSFYRITPDGIDLIGDVGIISTTVDGASYTGGLIRSGHVRRIGFRLCGRAAERYQTGGRASR
jgi:hypothetical protein